MKKLIWIIPVVIVFLSCKGQSNRQAADQNKLSVLIFHDSVIVYNGIIGKSTVYKKYLPTESEQLSETIEKHRHKYGPQSEIHLKIAYESSAGFTSLIQHIPEIIRQNSGPDLKMTDVSETEQQFFSILPFKWSFIDSLNKPSTLDLNMPREEPSEKKVPASLTLILFEDSILYFHKSLKDARKASYKGDLSIRNVIQKEKKNVPEKDLVIVIKPTASASYSNTVDILDEMTINNIKRFAMVKVTKEEEDALGVKPLSLDPAAPVTVETPSVTSQVRNEKGFLIEIKKDQSVWYSITTDKLEQEPQKINGPLRKTLGGEIGKYKKKCAEQGIKTTLLVKGHPNVKYAQFEEVIGSLRDNDEFKYNLITTDN
ncbi:MAG: ExbD/TolR family protein [Chitinophagales bacterium]